MDIGKLALQLTADAGQMNAGLKRAEEMTKAHHNKMADIEKAAANKSIANAKAAEVKKIEQRKALLSMTSFAGLGVAGVAAGAAVGGVGMLGGSAILDADKNARKLGLSINELRIAGLASVQAPEAMQQAFADLNVKLWEVRSGSLEATRLFAGLGIEGEKVGKSGVIGAFEQVAQKIQAIADPTQQAAAAWKVFGANYAAILPDLQRGQAGVARAKDVANRSGLFVGKEDLESVRAMARVFADLRAFWDGFVNQVTIALAPVAAQLAEMFDFSGKIDFSGLQAGILSFVEGASKAAAYVIAMFTDLTAIQLAWEILFHAVKGLIVNFVSYFVQQIHVMLEGLMGALGKVAKVADAVLGVGLAGMINDFSANAGGKGGVDPNKKDLLDAQNRLAELLERLNNSAAVKGTEKFFSDVRNRTGGREGSGPAPPPAWIIELGKKFDANKQAVADPVEAFNAKMREIEQMQAAGLFAGERAGLADRMRQQAFAGLQGAVGATTPGAVGAVQANTKEAYSAIAEHERRSQRVTVQEQMKALMEEAARQNAELIRIGQESLKAQQQLAKAAAGRGI